MSCCSDLQNKKGNILQSSVDYIKRLKKEQMAMSELVARQEELEKTNRQLALDVQVSYLHQLSILPYMGREMSTCDCSVTGE